MIKFMKFIITTYKSLRERCPYSQLFWSHFPAFKLNTDRYTVSLRIQSKYGNMWTRLSPNIDTIYAVSSLAVRKLEYNDQKNPIFCVFLFLHTYIRIWVLAPFHVIFMPNQLLYFMDHFIVLILCLIVFTHIHVPFGNFSRIYPIYINDIS